MNAKSVISSHDAANTHQLEGFHAFSFSYIIII